MILAKQKKLGGLLTIVLVFLIGMPLSAQLVVQQPVPIGEMLQQGNAQATVEPAFTVDSLSKIFDGNPFTEAGVQDTNRLTITLAFDSNVSFSGSKIYMWTAGTWTLEIANSLDDLDNTTGSYQLLVNQQTHSVFAWDSLEFGAQSARYVRLSLETSQSGTILVGEWVLKGTLTYTALHIYPYPPKVLPGTSLQLKIQLVDEYGNLSPYTLNHPLIWDTEDHTIATVGEFGKLTGLALGSTNVTVRIPDGKLRGSAPVSVLSDFQSPRAEPQTIRVALIIQDPIVDTVNNKRIHEVWRWQSPSALIEQIVDDFYRASGGAIVYDVVETHDSDFIFTTLDGQYMSRDTLIYFFTPSNGVLYGHVPGHLQYLAEDEGRVAFDYVGLVDYYNLDEKRNSGQIHEVWVYTFPFGGMYESRLVGPNGFWCNSPPQPHPGLDYLLPVMGWNYERGVAEALHSYGHRVESVMRQVYGRWDPNAAEPNNWELFTRIDKDHPGEAQVGNIHFPPNGQSDYDYANSRSVTCYADNWKRYPYLLDQHRTLNCSEWNCDQRDYMKWWFNHLPRYQGVYEGVLNNWWHYVVKYEEAVALADSLNSLPLKIETLPADLLPQGFLLEQNFPNPFNPETTIRFQIPRSQRVLLRVYNVLGQEVQTLVDRKLAPGRYQIKFDGKDLPSGVYYLRLHAGNFRQTRKMLLLK